MDKNIDEVKLTEIVTEIISLGEVTKLTLGNGGSRMEGNRRLQRKCDE